MSVHPSTAVKQSTEGSVCYPPDGETPLAWIRGTQIIQLSVTGGIDQDSDLCYKSLLHSSA
eukprot:scaffold7247_cov143-Skeletonema_menzelii.AAC.12